MIKNDIPIFSIPMRYGKLDTENLNKRLIEDIFVEYDKNDQEQRSGVNVYQTRTGLEQKYDSFNLLSQKIEEFVHDFLKHSGVEDDFSVKDLWANINSDSCAFHMPHSHGVRDSIMTGVYFPTSGFFGNDYSNEINKSDVPIVSSRTQPNPGDLVLLDPIENIKTAIATSKTKKYPFFGNPICITPIAGSIVVFPSYLSHMVSPTRKSNFTRISIAYNVCIQ